MAVFRDGRLRPFGDPLSLLRFSPLSPGSRVRYGMHVLSAKRRSDWSELENVPARDWLEAVAVFDSFEAAARFTATLTEQGSIVHRIASALEAPMAQTLTPIRPLFGPDQAAVLLIIDAVHAQDCRDLVGQFGGTYHFWRRPADARRCPLAYLVYGHRMLWIKKQVPRAAFLHCYLAPDAVPEQITLGPGERKAYYYGLEVVGNGRRAEDGAVSVALDAGHLTDGVQRTVKVVPLGFPQEISLAGTVDGTYPS